MVSEPPSPTATPTSTPTASPEPAPEGTVYQTIDGFGASERAFDDPHVFNNFDPATGRASTVLTAQQQDAVLNALYVDLGLTRVRPVQPDSPPDVEPTNDNSDPRSMNAGAFNFSWKRLDAHADFVARARARGVKQSFLSPLFREPWFGVTTANDVSEYTEWLLAMVRRSIQQGGALSHVSVANEPSFGRNRLSAAFIREVIKELGPRLAAEGLDVDIVANDDVRSSNAAKQLEVILADSEARQYIRALATHLYDEPVSNLAAVTALGEKYGLSVWMTEFHRSAMDTAGLGTTAFDWALLMHELLAVHNVSAIDYMWAYFGEYDGGAASLIDLNHTGATYDGFTRNKVYYYTGQYSRFIRPGDRRVSVTSSDTRVKVSAYHGGSRRTVVATNPSASPVPTTLTAADLQGVQTLDAVRTSATENWATPADISVTGASVSLTLPPASVTTLVGTYRP